MLPHPLRPQRAVISRRRDTLPPQLPRHLAARASGASRSRAAVDTHASGMERSATYASLFITNAPMDTEDEGERKKRLMMIGNPRGYVRC